jgi:hypothetical protein
MPSLSLGIDTSTWYVFAMLGYLIMLISPKTPPEIGELLGIPNAGRLVHRLVHNFPKLQ